MTTFARINGGYALDCQVAATPTELAARFNTDWLTKNPPPIDTTPKPTTPGNPYFGKSILVTKDFYALTGQVLAARYPRLRDDPAFSWVKDVIDKCDVIDPDDKKGQFLQVLVYLQHTNAADSQPLLSPQDIAAIMAAWPKV